MNGQAARVLDAKQVIVHFGCGNLGIGAVLPFLIRHYGKQNKLVAYQRLPSKNWDDVHNGMVITLQTSSGDFMPFRVVRMNESSDESSDLFIANLIKAINNEQRILVLGSDLQADGELLLRLIQEAQNRKSIISCSLSGGQNSLIRLLRISKDYWQVALVFENNTENWHPDNGIEKNEWHHVIVDRICSRVMPYDPDNKTPFIECISEDPANVQFLWSEENPILSKLNPEPIIKGAMGETVVPEWEEIQFDADQIDNQVLRKRALTNAPPCDYRDVVLPNVSRERNEFRKSIPCAITINVGSRSP